MSRPILLCVLALAGHGFGASEALRGQISLFIPLSPSDSVVALNRIGSGLLEVEWRDSTGENRKETQKIPATTLDRLIASARAENMPVTLTAAPDDSASVAVLTESPSGSVSGQRKNRLQYVGYQIIPSSYTYGLALMAATGAEEESAIGLVLFGATGSLVGHSIFAYNHSFEDAHIYSLRYAAPVSIVSSYLAALLVMGPDVNAFRFGSFLTLGAYPASLYLGYKHGDTYVNNPGRIDLEPVFTYSGVVAGYLSLIMTLADSHISDAAGTRLVAGTLLAAGTAGHFASHKYRPGEHIPLGVPGGIAAHTMLGFFGGLCLTATVEPDNAYVGAGLPFIGMATGFLEGLHFFRDSRDNLERSNFSALGALGGGLFSAGVLVLAQAEEPAPIFWTLYAGVLTGYSITYNLLKNAVETSADSRASASNRIGGISFDWVPLPEPVRMADAGWDWRLRVPGLTYRF